MPVSVCTWIKPLALNTVSSAPNNLTSLCSRRLQHDSLGVGGGQSVHVSTFILRQRAAGASRSESVVLWTMGLCFCTEPCDCHVSGSMAKSHSGHLQISVCVAWATMFHGCPILSFPLTLKMLAGILNTLQLCYCSLNIGIKASLFGSYHVVITGLLALDVSDIFYPLQLI